MKAANKPLLVTFLISSMLFVTVGCGGGENEKGSSKRAGKSEVILHESADCDKLNPVTYTSANSGYILGQLYQALLATENDPPYNLIPVLAVSRPQIEEITEGKYAGGLKFNYEIRPEAKWDNGTPITAKDVEFTLKAIKNPLVDDENQRPYYESIDAIEIDPTNERKFAIVCKEKYILAESVSGVTVMPKYAYDPDGLMDEFSVTQLNDPTQTETLKANQKIIDFAKKFNGEFHAREKEGVVGSGAYELDNWVTGQRITLKRKENWWGDAMKGTNLAFEANPPKLIYEIITETQGGLSALKGEKIDVTAAIPSKDYIEFEKDEKLTSKYNFHKPTQFAYSYFGINMRDPHFTDVRVRQALAHLTNVDEMIEVLLYGLATRVTGPINPVKPYYNHDLAPISYDLEKAKALLADAGWTDSDGDGVLDKVVNGEKIDMHITLKMPSGGETGEKIALLFQESCKKAGIDLQIVQREWTVFLEENDKHDFQLYMGGWVASPSLDDPKQIWHTASYNGGSNYVGFGDDKSDALIMKIRQELDETKRNELYKEFQKMIYDQQPYVFLFSSLNRMAIHKRFTHADAKTARPGYFENEFVLDTKFGE